jgi:hypothetical protein
MSDYIHVSWVEELEQIRDNFKIIRDQLRIARRRGENADEGIVVNQVYNELQQALSVLSSSGLGAADIVDIQQELRSPTTGGGGAGIAEPSGSGEHRRTRQEVLTGLGRQEDGRVIIRVDGLYYLERRYTPPPDDGFRGPITYEYVIDSPILGYEDRATNSIIQGPPPDPEAVNQVGNDRFLYDRVDYETSNPHPNPQSDLVNPITGDMRGQTQSRINGRVASGEAQEKSERPEAETNLLPEDDRRIFGN